MKSLSPKARRILRYGLLAIVIFLVGQWTWKSWLKPWLFPRSPLVMTPQIGLKDLKAKSLYYNGEARPWLAQLRPDLLAKDDRGFAQGTALDEHFTTLDRTYRFDTLLLLGDPSSYPRLLRYLLERPPEQRVYRLVYLDHWMLVFQRGAAREWQLADAEALRERMGKLHGEDKAAFLSKTAERMMAVGQLEAAKKWLDEAMVADPSSPDALAAMAGYFALLSKWQETESYADRALEMDENFMPALQRKYVALLGRKYLKDAFKISERLLKADGDPSPGRLLQHSRIAHMTEQYDVEITVLKQLIEMAERAQFPTGEYEFSLGEAHTLAARQDVAHVPLAAEHFRKALRDERLSKEMRMTAEDRLLVIQTMQRKEASGKK